MKKLIQAIVMMALLVFMAIPVNAEDSVPERKLSGDIAFAVADKASSSDIVLLVDLASAIQYSGETINGTTVVTRIPVGKAMLFSDVVLSDYDRGLLVVVYEQKIVFVVGKNSQADMTRLAVDLSTEFSSRGYVTRTILTSDVPNGDLYNIFNTRSVIPSYYSGYLSVKGSTESTFIEQSGSSFSLPEKAESVVKIKIQNSGSLPYVFKYVSMTCDDVETTIDIPEKYANPGEITQIVGYMTPLVGKPFNSYCNIRYEVWNTEYSMGYTDEVTFKLNYQNQNPPGNIIETNMPLYKGWNLVSVSDGAIDYDFADGVDEDDVIEAAYIWNPRTREYVDIFAPGDEVENLIRDYGFSAAWIYLNQDVKVVRTVDMTQVQDIVENTQFSAFEAGWNFYVVLPHLVRDNAEYGYLNIGEQNNSNVRFIRDDILYVWDHNKWESGDIYNDMVTGDFDVPNDMIGMPYLTYYTQSFTPYFVPHVSVKPVIPGFPSN